MHGRWWHIPFWTRCGRQIEWERAPTQDHNPETEDLRESLYADLHPSVNPNQIEISFFFSLSLPLLPLILLHETQAHGGAPFTIGCMQVWHFLITRSVSVCCHTKISYPSPLRPRQPRKRVCIGWELLQRKCSKARTCMGNNCLTPLQVSCPTLCDRSYARALYVQQSLVYKLGHHL